MDIKNLTSEEQVFIGEPADLGFCSAYPIKLRDIAKMGIKKFYECLNIFTLKTEDVKDFLKQNNVDQDLTTFQFHLIHGLIDENYLNTLNQAFKVFLHEDDITITNEAIVLGDIKDSRIIRQEEFDLICEVVAFQTILGGSSTEESSPEGLEGKAREIWESLHRGRQQLSKAKSVSGDSSLSFLDLVASFAAKGNGLNALNVWDMTYYAFQDQFQRMQWIEDYANGMNAVVHGADPKKVKIENWMQPMKNKNKK